MRIHRLLSLAVIAVAVLAGCGTARPVGESGGTCTSCHGGVDNQTGAPPNDTHRSATGPAVGKHTQHLNAGVACESCHVVPAQPSQAGHMNGQAEVPFGPAAKANGATPSYEASTQTCSNTYCHAPTAVVDGAKVSLGGNDPAPTWNGPARTCQSCHGFPPPTPPHSATTTNCFLCHSDTVNPDQTIKAGGKHLNGQVDTTISGGCTGCHGDANRQTVSDRNRAAPPKDTTGQTSSPQVGAHQIHLEGGAGAVAGPIRCEECHVYPGDLSHVGSRPAELTFGGPVGTANGAKPSYDPATRTCSNTYCHGATLGANGSHTAPTWAGGSNEAKCGTCHALVPPAPHPSADKSGVALTTPAQCNQCHPGTVDAQGNILAANGLHVNGKIDSNVHPDDWANPSVHGKAATFHDPAYPGGIDDCKLCHGSDFNGGVVGPTGSCNACHAAAGHPSWQTSADGCTFCHGDSNRTASPIAPPVDTLGHTAPTDRGTGAHLAHLQGKQPTGAISDGVLCQDCHPTPNFPDIGHVNGQLYLTLKRPGTNTQAGSFDATGGTCSNTYCHGNFGRAPRANTPTWNVPGTQSDCGTCHASQTGSDKHEGHWISNHLALGCAYCHPYTGSAPTLSTHVNGNLEVKAFDYNPTSHTCTNSCHGATSPDWTTATAP